MKKKIAFILAIAVMASFAACGNSEDSSTNLREENSSATELNPGNEPTQEPSSETTEDSSDESTEDSSQPADDFGELSQYISKFDFIDFATKTDTISGHIVDVYFTTDCYILDDQGNLYIYGKADKNLGDNEYNVELLAENTELTAIKGVEHADTSNLPNERGGYIVYDDSHIYDGDKKIDTFDDLDHLYMHIGTVEALFFGVDSSNNLRVGAYTKTADAPEKQLYELELSTAVDLTNVKSLSNGCLITNDDKIIDLDKIYFISQSLGGDMLKTNQPTGGKEDLVYMDYEKTPVMSYSTKIFSDISGSSVVLNEDNSFVYTGSAERYDSFENVDLSSISGDIVNVLVADDDKLIIETTDGYYGVSQKKGISPLEMLNGHKITSVEQSRGHNLAVFEDGVVYDINSLLRQF